MAIVTASLTSDMFKRLHHRENGTQTRGDEVHRGCNHEMRARGPMVTEEWSRRRGGGTPGAYLMWTRGSMATEEEVVTEERVRRSLRRSIMSLSRQMMGSWMLTSHATGI